MRDDSGPIAKQLADRLGGQWTLSRLGSSFFGRTWRAAGRHGSVPPLFLKSTDHRHADVLHAEADGLQALGSAAAACAEAPALRVPEVVGCWSDPASDTALLVIEWLPLAARPGAGFGAVLGRALAGLHTRPAPHGDGRFGWTRDNWLGATPQCNRFSAATGLAGWLEFIADARLGALARRLSAAGGDAELVGAVDRVIARLPALYADGHRPRPCLIHGDLWSGNWGALADGRPVLYDPAVSVSDAEAELAMMELFGSPPAGFWPAYREAAGWSAADAEGYARRRGLHQLYHLLNHALLFGGGYAAQARALAERLLRGGG